MATRWGIASAGKISHDFVTALNTLPSEEHRVIAVAAQQLDRAKTFATEHNIPNAYGSYEELAKDPDVEVVYIGAINTLHLDIGKLMLDNGKHVLCEKPLTVNLKQTTELINYAKEKKLFLMEAIWSRCFPAYEAVKKELEAGTMGEVLQVIANFGVVVADVDRVKLKELGGGTILDLGVYVLQLAQFVFGPSPPERVVAQGELNENGVDTSTSITLKYKGGRTATLCTHARVKLPNEAFIVGTKGIVKILEPFWCPTSITTPEKTKEFILPNAPKPFNFTNSAGLRYEATEVRRCLKQGLLESPKVSHEESLILAQLEDEIRKQLGVKYDQD
ncbi:trans-1,2-dihydrobenzene-1,2-diol dehydrogenase-like [Zootermopsis nevadensis]|uniref:Trans-1,2-dihydrobenzene-1,2-diol dehydrogenase n=1 Tax=Zootermopsis nevadensis TaxID=136037 RepID=A0A067QX71_ZOONE|nr:trans-1,2-dihydrobenzene-1,2-diol dehydrogenase-like [Zootermopsis nevadensis]KDR09314.1 Trans-1,2-dihydrobenzene-1,2-diol dehydrogenase [Zootermopsis nevadensis]